MITIENEIQAGVSMALKELFDYSIVPEEVLLQKTRKDFEGDFTIVVFPYLRHSKKGPEQTGEAIGEFLAKSVADIANYNVVKGFLNISLSDTFWISWLNNLPHAAERLATKNSGKSILLEYSSPNTNKPLHLGHIRNNLLGYSVSQILKANGNAVVKTQIINDKGIHICKSMLAWQKFGNDETPESSGLKGDKLVGKYYVRFDKEYKSQIADLIAEGHSEEEAKKKAHIQLEAQDMLRKWEQGDQEIMDLWNKMNAWVYAGFDLTYKRLGVDFDKLYRESFTYLYGKNKIAEGLEKGIFFKKDDGSVWCDLKDEGLDEKLLLRADGTTVYMTQDIGTALLRLQDYPSLNQLIYTVGNEQDYHFQVLFLILQKLGYSWAKDCYHLSYGMVDLPTGKMKSREGTVVDADDLMAEMVDKAAETAEELGKLEGISDEDKKELYEHIGLGALKYFILKVDPKKKMLFDPNESINFNGNTGPFIQYAHARIQAILKRGEHSKKDFNITVLSEKERAVIRHLYDFESTIDEAANEYSPAIVANYVYDLVKNYNSFYQVSPIFTEDNDSEAFRVQLSKKTGDIISYCLGLLGISAPERM